MIGNKNLEEQKKKNKQEKHVAYTHTFQKKNAFSSPCLIKPHELY